jgi:AcrR family transcriptional regulator
MAAPRAQRADARRNIAAILEAATDCLARDPEMSIAGIAAAAGVGRITLYGHFKTRATSSTPYGPVVQSARDPTPPTPGAPDGALGIGRVVVALVHQFRNICWRRSSSRRAHPRRPTGSWRRSPSSSRGSADLPPRHYSNG